MDIGKIGAFIRELRTEKKMTQKELAEKLSCTDKAVSRWETGKGFPDASLLLLLSEQLGVSVNELLSGEKFYIIDFAQHDNEEQEADTMTVPELITKTDATIVEIMKEKDTQIKKLNKSTIILLVLCCMQVIIFFVAPNIIGKIDPTFDGSFLVYATVINALLVGLLNRNIKWFYPIFTALLMLFVVPFAGSDNFLYGIFALYFFVGTSIIIGMCSVVQLIIKKLKNK